MWYTYMMRCNSPLKRGLSSAKHHGIDGPWQHNEPRLSEMKGQICMVLFTWNIWNGWIHKRKDISQMSGGLGRGSNEVIAPWLQSSSLGWRESSGNRARVWLSKRYVAWAMSSIQRQTRTQSNNNEK